MDKIVITGGTGFLGLSLADHLAARGFKPIIIARNPPKQHVSHEFAQWDAVNEGVWAQTLNGARAVVNLAGRTVDCIKTPANKDLILRSRVDSTKAIGKALRKVANPPPVWIQMSTAHIYGDPPTQVCTESSTFGLGLAPFVGQAWEKALKESLPEGMREVRLRTSFVVGKNGGALASLRRIAQMGLGGKSGHGRQGFSWIHEFDINEFVRRAILEEQWQGAYILSAPNPVSNADFMRTLRKQLKMPIGLPAPAWMVRFGAHYLFRTDPELALYGRYVRSERLEAEGFTFKFPELRGALADLLG